MAAEGKGIALAVLGVVAVLAIVGLVLLFTQSKVTGDVARAGYSGEHGTFVSVAEPKYNRDSDSWRRQNQEYGQPVYYSEGYGVMIGTYPRARYSGYLPGGNAYLK